MKRGAAGVLFLILAVLAAGCGPPAPPTVVEISLIPAGNFEMGDSFNEGARDELPVHTVFVSAFTMDKCEVTKALWNEVASWAAAHGYDINPKSGMGKAADHPVWGVTWYEAVKWANARSEREGLTPCYTVHGGGVYRTGVVEFPTCDWSANGYRLPTEAEWEKAARGGAEGNRFPWSDTDTIQHARANYASASYGGSYFEYDTSPTRGYHPDYATGGYPYTSSTGKSSPNTSPVASFAPNGYGLYDMVGNVEEWCWDLYCEMMRWDQPTYYESSPKSDPHGGDWLCETGRAVRGGSWSPSDCRVANRGGHWPESRFSGLGFRLVRTAR